MPTVFPACMEPDGGDPCKMFTDLQEQNERLRAANEAADKYIDRLEDIMWRGNTAAPDVNQCKRMYAHHKLQLHSKPAA